MSVNDTFVGGKRKPYRRGWGRDRVAGTLGSTALGVYVGFIALWMIFPMLVVILASLEGTFDISLIPEKLSLDSYAQIPQSYWDSFWFTLWISLAATVVALVVAVPAGWALVRGRLRERRIISNLVLVPIIVPQLILGIALLGLFIPLQLKNTFLGIMIALTGLNLALAIRFTEALIQGVPEEYELAAQSLGAGRFTVFRTVVLPVIAQGIIIAGLFIFMQDLISFVILFFIAGPSTTPIAIRLFVDIVQRGVLPYAVAMACVLVYVALAFYAIVAFIFGPKYLTGAPVSRKG